MIVIEPERGVSPAVAAYGAGYTDGFRPFSEALKGGQYPAYAETEFEHKSYELGYIAGLADFLMRQPRGTNFFPPTEEQLAEYEQRILENLRFSGARF